MYIRKSGTVKVRNEKFAKISKFLEILHRLILFPDIFKILMVNVKKSHSCYANVFMMLSACLSCLQKFLRACQRAVQLKTPLALPMDLVVSQHHQLLPSPLNLRLQLTLPFVWYQNRIDFSGKFKIFNSHPCKVDFCEYQQHFCGAETFLVL